MTAYCCPTCGHSLQGQLATFEVRQRIALHRQAHERVERRRAQWRESARRKRAALRADSEGRRVAGYLHELGCRGGHVKGRAKCVPIPCYDRPVDARMGGSRIELHNARIPDDLPVVLNPLPGGRSAPSGLRR